MPDVTVIVPTFNEGPNVGELVHRLAGSFGKRTMEILFVDDSTDDTPDVIRMQAKSSPVPVRVLHREGELRVGGLSGAVVAGIRASLGELIVVMDGDLQHPPELAAHLVETLERQDADLVVASRYLDDGDAGGLSSRFRRSVSQSSTHLARLLFRQRVGIVCTDPMTGFFCFRRSAIQLERLRPRGFKILLEILVTHSLNVAEIPFVFGDRTAGDSKASWRNGLSFLLQVLNLRVGRGARFAMVGGIGFVINLALMALMLQGGLHYVPAAIIATEITIVSNFLMQERFVFHDLLQGRLAWRARAVQAVLYNNADALVRLPVLVVLVERGHLGSLAAQGLTLVASFGARFVFNHKVIYRQHPSTRPAAIDLTIRSAEPMDQLLDATALERVARRD